MSSHDRMESGQSLSPRRDQCADSFGGPNGLSVFGLAHPWNLLARRLAAALIATAVLTGFGYVYCYGVDIYWGDDWDTLPILFEKHAAGTLGASDFWEIHNEHRIVFPKLVLFGLGWLTQGSALVGMYLGELLLLASFAIFFVAARDQFGSSAIWLLVPVAFLTFSLRQWENMLWDFQISFFMVAAAMLGTFLCLSHLKNERHVLMGVSAVSLAAIASFSSAQGLLVWPVGAGQILVSPLAKRRKMLLVSLWSILGIAAWTAYFSGIEKLGHHPPAGFPLSYFLKIVGGSFFENPTSALVVGVLILALAVTVTIVVLKRRQWGEHSFWLATIASALLTLGSITIARAGFGSDQALSSRYSTFSIPLVIATFVLCVLVSRDRWRPVAAFWGTAVLLSLIAIGLGVSNFTGLQTGRRLREERLFTQATVCTMDLQPNAMICQFYNYEFRGLEKAVILNAVAAVKKLKMNVFSHRELCDQYQLPPPSSPSLPGGTPFKVSGVTPYVPGSLMRISGWAVDWPDGRQDGDLAGGVAVVLDGVAHPACYGLPSKEAVKQLGDKTFLNSGFGCVVAASDLGRGRHSVSLKISNRDRTAVFVTPCDIIEIN